MKISLKMLLLTLGSFLLLIIGVIASLYLYFDQFYEPKKIDRIINSINEFTDSYQEKQWTDEELYNEVSKFMTSQNATMSILPNASFTISPTSIAGEAGMAVSLQKADVQSESIALEGSDLPKYSSGTAASINGTLVLYPQAVEMSSVQVAFPYGDVKRKNGVNYTTSTIPYTKYHQVNFIKEFTLNNGDTKVTSVNLSLQSVDEVMDFFIGFFPYLIIAAILLSFLMVRVYSKTIIKPIMYITKISNRMADMELGITSDLKRKDELGNLSLSLNTLSANLKNALGELSTANEQLKIDYEQELRQEQARKEFVANVSHEMKTPLGIIKSYSEGIRDGVKTEKRDYYVEVILDEVNRMDQMLHEMLEISKFDAGVVEFHKSFTDINILVEKSARTFENTARDRNVMIQINGEFGTVFIDGEKIERVLNNLIGNAVKYCNSHSNIIVTGKCDENTQTILIHNECEAFSDEALTKIWNRFYKVDASHNRETEGTGLGLAITKSILEGHGCQYGAENTDTGVCFFFEVDRVDTAKACEN